MKTAIYWTVQHIHDAAHDLRFRAKCWWLSQQVDFLEWRWHLEAPGTSVQVDSAPTLSTHRERYVAASMA